MRAGSRWKAGLLWLALASPTARAGNGPWTLSAREHNLYASGDYYRYGTFNGVDRGAVLPTSISGAGATAVWTFGMAYGLEAEVKLSFEAVRVDHAADELCAMEGVPRDWCDPTANLGDLGARVKWRLVDEAFGAPVSIAVAASARSGEAYANERARLTTLGDGVTDAGGGVAVGRAGSMGRGWYAAALEGAYWYRFPNRTDAGRKVPGDEISFELDTTLALHPRLGLGPAASGFTRLQGVALDPGTADFADPDYWSTLRATQVKVGGKVGIYSVDNGPTVSITVLRTAYAANNPADTLAVSVGVGQWLRPREEAEP